MFNLWDIIPQTTSEGRWRGFFFVKIRNSFPEIREPYIKRSDNLDSKLLTLGIVFI